ncbi:hypothetical protein T12_1822 [Trichinella patagoniensis]|uniref:Uncharacterized protein n=1 Tax=Trichinella patagoniensis TaxID=990121 RepID=A0A0V1A929_9BILA|nr:hypothetical protein T12_1822 [Trichinella patagoniensis]
MASFRTIALHFADGKKITDWIGLSMKIEKKTFPAAFDLMTSFAIETDQFQSNCLEVVLLLFKIIR